MKTVTAAEANRHFSKILREVRGGETVLVTSHGKPVATIAPADRLAAGRSAANEELLTYLRSLKPQNIPITWTRDELYDD